MAFDFNAIKKGLKKSAENIRQSVGDASQKVADSVQDLHVTDSVKGLAQKGQSTFTNLRSKGGEALAAKREKREQERIAVSEALQLKSEQELVLSVRDSMRIICCLMVVDGTISDEEKEKIIEIGQELDPTFAEYQLEILEEAVQLMNQPSEDEEDFYDNVHDHVSTILHETKSPKGNGIRGKILLWDLLAVAFSEGDYSPGEKRLLRFIAKGVGVDYAVLLEMEHTVRTLLAIEEEERWMKQTDRPYAVVEERVNELSNRQKDIITGVRALLAD